MSDVITWTADSRGFGMATSADDFYHGLCEEQDPSMTETWFWAFQEESVGLHGFVYIWLHPNLNVCMGGLFAHFGDKTSMLACELSDFVTYGTMNIFDSNGNITLQNGLKVTFQDPMKKARITYTNETRGFSLDMVQEAFMPAVMRSNNKHFEQGMRCTGEVCYGGQSYRLDHLTVRDRSWQEPRPEAGLKLPPYTWMTAAFSESFSFTIAAHDDPALDPEWKDAYSVTTETALKDGWIWNSGAMEKVVAVSKITERDLRTLAPRWHRMTATTESGRSYHLVGEIISAAPMTVWHNNLLHVGLTRWSCDEVPGVGWGDTQEVKWNDYVARFTAA